MSSCIHLQSQEIRVHFLSDCLKMTATRYVQRSVIIRQSTSSNNPEDLNILQHAVTSANLACVSFVVSVNYSLLTLTFYTSVRTTLVYNVIKRPFVTLLLQNSSYLTGNTQSLHSKTDQLMLYRNSQ